MSNDMTHTPAYVRGRILRASILPFEDEETLIAGLRAGAEAVERGELDVDDFVGVWSQYLRQLIRASSVPAPADVRERVTGAWATVEAAALAQANLLDSNFAGQSSKAAEIREAVEQVAALLRTTRGDGEAAAMSANLARALAAMQAAWIEWRRGRGADAAMQWIENTLIGHGLIPGDDESDAQAFFDCAIAEIENHQIRHPAALRSEAQGDAEALAALVVRIWTRCRIEGPNYRETDEFWADFERAYQLCVRREWAQGEVWREIDDLLARLEKFEYDAAGESEGYWMVVTIRDWIAAARRGEGGGA